MFRNSLLKNAKGKDLSGHDLDAVSEFETRTEAGPQSGTDPKIGSTLNQKRRAARSPMKHKVRFDDE